MLQGPPRQRHPSRRIWPSCAVQIHRQLLHCELRLVCWAAERGACRTLTTSGPGVQGAVPRESLQCHDSHTRRCTGTAVGACMHDEWQPQSQRSTKQHPYWPAGGPFTFPASVTVTSIFGDTVTDTINTNAPQGAVMGTVQFPLNAAYATVGEAAPESSSPAETEAVRGTTEPSVTAPPATEPAATEPPPTQGPGTEPPATQLPAAEPSLPPATTAAAATSSAPVAATTLGPATEVPSASAATPVPFAEAAANAATSSSAAAGVPPIPAAPGVAATPAQVRGSSTHSKQYLSHAIP